MEHRDGETHNVRVETNLIFLFKHNSSVNILYPFSYIGKISCKGCPHDFF